MTDKGDNRGIVDEESGILHDSLFERRISNLQASHLREKRDFKQRHWRYTPWLVMTEPWELLQSPGAGDDPKQEVCVQKEGHLFSLVHGNQAFWSPLPAPGIGIVRLEDFKQVLVIG